VTGCRRWNRPQQQPRCSGHLQRVKQSFHRGVLMPGVRSRFPRGAPQAPREAE
jgi:hypothetical protein